MGFYEGNDFAGPVDKIVSNPEVRQFNLKTSRGLLELINDKLESKSHFYMFFRSCLEYIRFRIGLTDHYIPKILYQNTDHIFRKTEDVFEKISMEFRNGPKFFLFLIPHRITVDEKYRREMLRIYRVGKNAIDTNRPKLIFQALLKKFQLKGIDLTPYFLREEPSSLYYHIDGHWNLKGNRVVADILLPHILALIE